MWRVNSWSVLTQCIDFIKPSLRQCWCHTVCVCRASWGRADLLADVDRQPDMHTATRSQQEDHIHRVLLSARGGLGHGVCLVSPQKFRYTPHTLLELKCQTIYIIHKYTWYINYSKRGPNRKHSSKLIKWIDMNTNVVLSVHNKEFRKRWNCKNLLDTA